MQKLTATLPLRVEVGHLRQLPGSFGVEREDWHVKARPQSLSGRPIRHRGARGRAEKNVTSATRPALSSGP